MWAGQRSVGVGRRKRTAQQRAMSHNDWYPTSENHICVSVQRFSPRTGFLSAWLLQISGTHSIRGTTETRPPRRSLLLAFSLLFLLFSFPLRPAEFVSIRYRTTLVSGIKGILELRKIFINRMLTFFYKFHAVLTIQNYKCSYAIKIDARNWIYDKNDNKFQNWHFERKLTCRMLSVKINIRLI